MIDVERLRQYQVLVKGEPVRSPIHGTPDIIPEEWIDCRFDQLETGDVFRYREPTTLNAWSAMYRVTGMPVVNCDPFEKISRTRLHQALEIAGVVDVGLFSHAPEEKPAA